MHVTNSINERGSSKDVRRQIADIVELEGFVVVADEIRKCSDLSAIRIENLKLPPSDNVGVDVLAANHPLTPRADIERVLQKRAQSKVLQVAHREALIDDDVAQQISTLLQ